MVVLRGELASKSFCKSSVTFFAVASVCFQFNSPVSVWVTWILKAVAMFMVEYRRWDIGVCFDSFEVRTWFVRVLNLSSLRSLTEDLDMLIDDGYLYRFSRTKTWPDYKYL